MIAGPQLTIGQIVRRALTMIETRWKALLTLSLVASLPLALIDAFVPKAVAVGPAGGLLSLIALLIYIITMPAVFAILRNDANDAPSALRWGFGRLGPTVRAILVSLVVYAALVFVLMIVWSVLIVVFAMVFMPGAVGAPGATPAKLMPVLVAAGVVPALMLVVVLPPIWLCMAVMNPIVIYERTGGWAAARLAWNSLVARTRQRGWLRGFTLIALTQVPSYGISVLANLLTHSMSDQQWPTAVATVLVTPFSLVLDFALSYVIAQNMLARLRGGDL